MRRIDIAFPLVASVCMISGILGTFMGLARLSLAHQTAGLFAAALLWLPGTVVLLANLARLAPNSRAASHGAAPTSDASPGRRWTTANIDNF